MNYYYFISSLPMLDFQRPVFEGGVAAFDEMCRISLDVQTADKLAEISLENPPLQSPVSEVQRQFLLWDTNLRNAVANIAMPDGAAQKYLQKEEDYFSEIESVVQNAASKNDPLEKDRAIDSARFSKLEELSAFAGFGFESLAAYRMKLLLIEKYAALNVEKGEENFDILVKEILEANKNKHNI